MGLHSQSWELIGHKWVHLVLLGGGKHGVQSEPPPRIPTAPCGISQALCDCFMNGVSSLIFLLLFFFLFHEPHYSRTISETESGPPPRHRSHSGPASGSTPQETICFSCKKEHSMGPLPPPTSVEHWYK